MGSQDATLQAISPLSGCPDSTTQVATAAGNVEQAITKGTDYRYISEVDTWIKLSTTASNAADGTDCYVPADQELRFSSNDYVYINVFAGSVSNFYLTVMSTSRESHLDPIANP